MVNNQFFNKFRKLFQAVFYCNIGSFVKFLHGVFKPFDNSIVSMKNNQLVLLASTGISSPRPMPLFTNLQVVIKNVMVWKFQKTIGRFTAKWNVSHNLVWMKTIINYRDYMLVVIVISNIHESYYDALTNIKATFASYVIKIQMLMKFL